MVVILWIVGEADVVECRVIVYLMVFVGSISLSVSNRENSPGNIIGTLSSF